MYSKKKLAVIALSLCCCIGIGGAAYYSITKNWSAPSTQEDAFEPPTGYSRTTTEAPLYTDPTEPLVTENTGNVQISENAETEEAPENTESNTVSGTLPRPDYFELPLGLDIVQDYSVAEPVFNSTMGDWRTHAGVDFAGVIGDPVKASAAGFVTDVYDDPMYGVVMEIDHGGGITAKYCGLGKGSTIAVGTEVKTNDTIGYLGTVPCEADAGAHLHMEMTENGETVDPLVLFELA